MTKVRGVTGGGYDGNKVSHVNGPKVEPRPHPVDVGAVSRLGAMIGEGTPHKPLYYNKVSASTPVGPTDGMDCRPGGNGREVMKAGSQATTPRPTPRTHGPKTF
jgi:hypothetical protein